MIKSMKSKIPENKFSNIAIYENGIKLEAMVGPKEVHNVYISNSDLTDLLKHIFNIGEFNDTPKRETNIEYEQEDYAINDDDEDVIMDAVYN